ncbi:MAG: ribosome biogenesis GTPase Der [Candidatus Berkelbacteria bacterium]|nr:ribosome biogenesis GTPase Der [Candidatus Berkelbacteria bacterium]
MKKQPIIAIVGKPNVGKSTFFNRLCGRRQAIESEIPGTTRDRIYSPVNWCKKKFILIDTAGIFSACAKNEMNELTEASVETAISEADKIIFLLDATSEIESIEIKISKKLRASGKKIYLLANKADNANSETIEQKYFQLGFGAPNFVSAISGRSVGDFLDILTADISTDVKEIISDDVLKVAIIGRPNVGKSTLLNSLIGEEKAIVSSIAGTTRDATKSEIIYAGVKIEFVDTAGIRRSGKIDRNIEKFSVIRAVRAISESQVAVILLNAEEGLVNQDAHLCGLAKDEGKSIIIAVNKIDVWPENEKKEKMSEFIYKLQKDLAFLPFAPVIFVSAKDEKNLKILLKKILEVKDSRATKIPEDDLKKLIDEAIENHPQIRKVIKFYQEKTNPPIFKLLTKNKEWIHFSHLRYLENKIRDQFPMPSTPIFIDVIETKKKHS